MKSRIGLFFVTVSLFGGIVQTAEVSRYSGTAKAEVINGLRAGKKVCAAVATMSDIKDFFTTDKAVAPTIVIPAQLAEHIYNVLCAALEEGDLLVKIKNITLRPVMKSNRIVTETIAPDGTKTIVKELRGLLDSNKNIEGRKYARQVSKAFIKEVAHTTTGKVAGMVLAGDENRIYRRICKLVVNTILDGVIAFSVDYYKNTVSADLLNTQTLENAWKKGYKDALATFVPAFLYEILGEMLISSIEGDDGVALLDLLKLSGLSSYFTGANQDGQVVTTELPAPAVVQTDPVVTPVSPEVVLVG
ncbi:MAG: hypothetical protein ABH827_00340 [bacterium]